MSTIVNTSGVKAGSIYRIKLINFVTYKDVELYPGSSLNMIIGPNGTGKSTFVSALILGLCGNIASIGRAKKISEYVRADCEKATIEIDLYQERGKPNVKITRVFDLKDMSKWYIDNKPVSQKNVKDLIASFDIQVDNLCQLLPQDRVKDFAKMKPHTLLQSTLSAIGEEKRVDQLEKLKKWRSEQCNLDNKLQKNDKRKQDLIKENEILQSRIDTINRRKEIDNEIKVCNVKKLWLEEAILRRDCQQYDKEKKIADKLVKTNRKMIQPLEDSLKNIKGEIRQMEDNKRSLNTKINELRDQINDSLTSVEIQNNKIKEAHSWFLEVEKSHAKEAKDLETAKCLAKAELDRLQVDLSLTLNEYGNDTAMASELTKLQDKLDNLLNEKIALTQQRDNSQYDYDHSVFPEMARCRCKINALEDGKNRRLETLKRYSSDAYNALMWLQKNRHLFSGPVCEPMMLEIGFPDSRFARYLEATVPRRDLLAFTFLNAEDMNLFLRKVKQEQGLRQVNAVCSPPVRGTFESPDIRGISKYGFQTYLVNTFTADEMIVRYLCRTYNVHNIPIGNDYTYLNSAKVPEYISLFFSENHRISVKVSKYSGEKSASVNVIQTPSLLADTVDVEQINEWRKRLADLEGKQQVYENKRKALDTQIGNLEKQYNKYIAKQTAIQEHKGRIKFLLYKINSQEAVIQKQIKPSINMEEERNKCANTQRECIDKQVKLHKELVEIVTEIHQYTLLMKLLSMGLKKKRNSIVDQEKELFDLNNKLAEAQERLNSIHQMEEEATQRAAAKLKEALRSSDNKKPDHPQFPAREIYRRLPADLTQLRDHCNVLITKIDCMTDSDEGDLQTYEKNKKLIEQLSLDETAVQNDKKKLESSMARMKAEWTQFVKKLVMEINLRFRKMFAELGFGGEVKLGQGTCEEDFGSYGVVIMVKFRPGEPLRDLTPFEQSGGERAISTAVYLFALQHLTRVPFRCVDEINQGMDSQNERKMFEFLVKVTTEGQQGQYFLLTPKLLPNLEYNEKITVHTIMNGRGAMTYDKWQMESFIDNMRSYNQPC